MAKKAFGLTFDGERNNKDGIKKKPYPQGKKKKAKNIHNKYIIYEKPTYKILKTYYYTFPEIILKGGAPSARLQEITNRNLKKKYIKEKLAEIRNKRARTAQRLERSNQD